MVENDKNLGFNNLDEDDDFELDYDLGEDDMDFEDDSDIDFSLDSDDTPNSANGQLSFTPDKMGTSKALKLRDFTKMTLSMSDSKPNQQVCEMLAEIEFNSDAEAEMANALRDQLYQEADNSSAIYYRDLLNQKEEVKVAQLKKHISYVDSVYKRFTSLYSAKVRDAAQVKASLEDSLRAPRESLKTKENNNDKYADLRYNELKFNYGEVEVRYYQLLRQGKEYVMKTQKVLDFLNKYYQLYSQFSKVIAENKYKDTALIRDGEIADNYLTCKCTGCGGENIIHTNKLPRIEVGRMTYNIDILENLKTIYNYCISVETEVKKHALEILHKTLVSANMESVYEKAVETYEDDYDKIFFLERPQVISAMTNEDKEYYTKVLKPQLKNPARFILINTYNSLCLDNIPLKSQGDSVIFKDITVPTLRNVLNNRHPLLQKGAVDTINANSKTVIGVPVWKEILTGGSKEKPNEYQTFKNTLKLIDFIHSQLDDNFQYPNDSLVTKNVDIAFQAEKMQGTINVLPNSPLRYVVPDITCQQCGKPLLFHSSIMYAGRCYLEHVIETQTLIDVMDSATVNLTAIMGPALKAKSRVRSKNVRKYAYNHLDRINSMRDKSNKQRESITISTPDGELSDGYSSVNIAELEMAKKEFGFVTDQLASKYCMAKRRGDKIVMEQVLKENEERKNRGRVQQNTNTITPERVSEVMEQTGIPSEELAIQYIMAQQSNNEDEMNRILEEVNKNENGLKEDLLAEYGDADLNTLSFEELTSKGLYKYENLLNYYNLSETQFDCVEAILISVMGDEKSLETLPTAIQEAIHQSYEFRDGTPAELLETMGIMM